MKNPNVVCEGFLSKKIPAEYERLTNHFKNSDFFILPTRFEAYGLVFCEAAAYGLPVLASNTGGISTIVAEGQTGFLFDLSAEGNIYGDKIISVMNDLNTYHQLRTNARKRFEERLNWDVFGLELQKEISRIL